MPAYPLTQLNLELIVSNSLDLGKELTLDLVVSWQVPICRVFYMLWGWAPVGKQWNQELLNNEIRSYLFSMTVGWMEWKVGDSWKNTWFRELSHISICLKVLEHDHSTGLKSSIFHLDFFDPNSHDTKNWQWNHVGTWQNGTMLAHSLWVMHRLWKVISK